jgi:hypothetical protein
LHPLLTHSNFSGQIWVAQGTDDLTATCEVTTDGLSIYGGFANGMTNLTQRDPDTYVSIIDGGDSRRVMWIKSNDVLVDGLTIQNGYVDGNSREGGGILFKNTANPPTNLVVRNCTVQGCVPNNPNNAAVACLGAGMAFVPAASATVLVEDCLVDNNRTVGPYKYIRRRDLRQGVRAAGHHRLRHQRQRRQGLVQQRHQGRRTVH